MDLATLAQAALWLPDLFAHLWDALVPQTHHITSECWDTQDFSAEEDLLVAAIRAARDGMAPFALTAYLQDGPESERLQRQFIAARAIDDALADLHPGRRPRTLPPGLAALHDHYLSEARFNRYADGWVLPRGPLSPLAAPRPEPGDRPVVVSGDRLDGIFRYLRRVQPEPSGRFKYRHALVPARHDFDPAFDPNTLKIAVVPWGETTDAVRFAGRERNGKALLDCACVEPPAVAHDVRADALIERLDAQDVHVAVLPELVVSPEATAALKGALKRRLAYRPGSVRLLVAGSGLHPPKPAAAGQLSNTSVVLAGTGATLWSQRKLNHYAMSASSMRRFGLDACIVQPGSDHSEDVATGNVVEIRHGRLGRMAVLICEDMSQTAPRDHLLDTFRPDWVFAPILDGEVEVGRWVHQKGWRQADDFQTNVVIATSLVLARRLPPATKCRFTVGLGISPKCARAYFPFAVDLGGCEPVFDTTIWNHALWPTATIG